jgi:hypothetical protein
MEGMDCPGPHLETMHILSPLTIVSRSSINFGIASKLGGMEVGHLHHA